MRFKPFPHCLVQRGLAISRCGVEQSEENFIRVISLKLPHVDTPYQQAMQCVKGLLLEVRLPSFNW